MSHLSPFAALASIDKRSYYGEFSYKRSRERNLVISDDVSLSSRWFSRLVLLFHTFSTDFYLTELRCYVR